MAPHNLVINKNTWETILVCNPNHVITNMQISTGIHSRFDYKWIPKERIKHVSDFAYNFW